MQVDWDLAARIARSAAGDDGAPLSLAPDGLAATAAAARDQIVAATGLEPRAPLPAAGGVDRGARGGADLRTMRATLGPALEQASGDPDAAGFAGRIQAAGGALVAAEIGGLLGLFARRVLGQYELDLTDPDVPPRLLLVGPNLDRAA